ncbi:SDR family NAD(P)-dependent oxidoreductase [Faecalimonas canis]
MKIAIITGASSGFGREFVRQIDSLYKELDEIWVIARRVERLRELQSRTMTKLRVFGGDLLKEEIYDELSGALAAEQPNIRMLVNAAGFGKTGTVEEIDEKTQLEMIDTNCKSLTYMTLICLPYLEKGSRVVNIASAAAFCPQPSFAVYAATKSYVLSFSRALRAELEDRRIYVTAVCPGPAKTEFFDIAGMSANILKKMTMAKPEKVVKQALIDAKNKKEVSVYGVAMKAARVLTKIIPHKLVVEIMKQF